MTRQERIFDAIGGVDARLLERSERTARRRKRHWGVWGTALAACLALALVLWGKLPESPVMDPDAPVIDAEPGVEPPTPSVPVIDMADWADGPRVHLLSLRVPSDGLAGPQFYLYLDEESYYTCWQDGTYVIRPVNTPENLPECVMEVFHMGADPAQAAGMVSADLQSRYAYVTEIDGTTDDVSWKMPAGTLYYFVSSDGMEWDDAQRETFLVDDGQGGVFVVSYAYFTEAAEGHGTRFAGIAATFRAVPPDGRPEWMSVLDDTVERLMEGVFSGDMDGVADLLLPSAEVDGYDAGEADDVVVRSIDKVVNDEDAPTAAIVTVPYSLSPEEPGGTLVMELAYDEAGSRWLAWRIVLER